MKNEPVLTIAAGQAAVASTLTLIAAFGIHLTADQTAAILGAYAATAPIVFGLWARRKVTPS